MGAWDGTALHQLRLCRAQAKQLEAFLFGAGAPRLEDFASQAPEVGCLPLLAGLAQCRPFSGAPGGCRRLTSLTARGWHTKTGGQARQCQNRPPPALSPSFVQTGRQPRTQTRMRSPHQMQQRTRASGPFWSSLRRAARQMSRSLPGSGQRSSRQLHPAHSQQRSSGGLSGRTLQTQIRWWTSAPRAACASCVSTTTSAPSQVSWLAITCQAPCLVSAEHGSFLDATCTGPAPVRCSVCAGREYEQRLRQQHKKLHPRTGWARRRPGANDGGVEQRPDGDAQCASLARQPTETQAVPCLLRR